MVKVMPESYVDSPILRLPHCVRINIYRYAGVPTKTEIHLNGNTDLLNRPGRPRRDRDRDYTLSSSHALLLTCRLFYKEVTGLLFATNLLLLKPTEPTDLCLLLQLRPGTVKLLRRLTIPLHALSGFPNEPCEGYFEGDIHSNRGTYATKPVSLYPEDQVLLDEWQSAIAWVLQHAKPNALRLHALCDCNDLQTARYVCKPIWDSSNTLADCAIRLGKQPTQELSQEASMTARRAMNQFSPKGVFPFLQLPLEIQRHILEFTDLLTPQGEVEWAPRIGYQTQILRWHEWDGAPDSCCGEPENCHHVDCYRFQEDGCFCRRYHSAYSRICKCWMYPDALFRVSRAFKERADAVFFSRNRFIVRSKRGFDRIAKYTPRRVAPTIFFSTIGNNLKHLTYLEIVFPPIDHDYLRYSDAAYPHWVESISYARDKLNLPNLTLVVVMAEVERSGGSVTTFRHNMSSEQGDIIIEMYFRIVRPLRRLREKGLKRFYVTLAWPYTWTDYGQHLSRSQRKSVEREVAELEQRAEREVMGEDYDSAAMGKNDNPRSLWSVHYDRTLYLFQHSVPNSESENDLDE